MPDEGELSPPTPLDHWNGVWDRADPDRVSWFEPLPEESLALIESSGVGSGAGLIDVGAGASMLTNQLLEAGYTDLTVLDISAGGLAAGRERLGSRASEVEWIRADVREFDPPRTWDLWHDRAVFHFLCDEVDRARYVARLASAVPAGGHIIIATFGLDGPEQCSGLPIMRYEPKSLSRAIGAGFDAIGFVDELHYTPAGGEQHFLYGHFRRSPVGV